MALRSVLLLSLFVAIAVASPNYYEPNSLPKAMRMAKEWQLRALRRSRLRLKSLLSDLANLETASQCKASRRQRISELLDDLRKARACLYRGIGYTEYNRLRALCQDRSEIRDDVAAKLAHCSKKTGDSKSSCIANTVAPLKEKLQMAFEACRTIGWKGDGRVEREGCPSVMGVKEELNMVKAIKCGSAPAEADLLEDIEKAKGRIAYLLGLIRPRPSVQPRPAGE